MIRRILLFLLISVLFISCSNKDTKASDTIFFEVDSLLLDEKYYDEISHISFNPPKKWKPISSEMLEMLQKKAKIVADTGLYEVIPIKVFENPSINSFCFFSCINELNPNTTGEEIYISEIKERYSDHTIKEGSYVYHDLDIEQLIIFDKETVIIKLLIDSGNDNLFQLDYIIPKKYYEENIRVIESSIGSLKYEKTKGERV